MANRTAQFKTNLGSFSVELFEDRAPKTTKNFIDLAEKKFFMQENSIGLPHNSEIYGL